MNKERQPNIIRYDQEIYDNDELRLQLRVRRIEAFLEGFFSLDQLLRLELPKEKNIANLPLRELLESAQDSLSSGLDTIENIVKRLLPDFGPVKY